MTTPGPLKNPSSAESKLEQGIKTASIGASSGAIGDLAETKKQSVEKTTTSGTAAAGVQKAQKDAAKLPPKKEATKETGEDAMTATSSTFQRKDSAAKLALDSMAAAEDKKRQAAAAAVTDKQSDLHDKTKQIDTERER